MKKERVIAVGVFAVFVLIILIGMVSGKSYNITDCTDNSYDSVNKGLQWIHNDYAQNYNLTKDINCAGYSFESIGDGTNPFTGRLDGQGYKIKNLNIVSSDAGGLFARTSGATIKNLSLENANIYCANCPGGNCQWCHAGALAGFLENTNVNQVSIKGGMVYGYGYVGGLAGYMYNSNIRDSYAYTNPSGSSNTGGFIGYIVFQSSGIITNCYATGPLNMRAGEDGGFIGGKAQGVTASFSNNYWDTTTNTGHTLCDIGRIGGFCDNSPLGITKKTSGEMKTQATYYGWDFTNIWHMPKPEGSYYPMLALESRCGDGMCADSLGENCLNCIQDCACTGGKVCDSTGLCCQSDCSNRECGNDGCGGSCGTCTGTDSCMIYSCQESLPSLNPLTGFIYDNFNKIPFLRIFLETLNMQSSSSQCITTPKCPGACMNGLCVECLNNNDCPAGKQCNVSGYCIDSADVPSADSIMPFTGSSNINQDVNFITNFSDINGWQDLSYAMLDFDSDLINPLIPFWFFYNIESNKFSFKNKSNGNIIGECSPGENQIIENSYAKLNCNSSIFSGSGNTLSIKWQIIFKGFYDGKNMNSYLYAKDKKGNATGFADKGDWRITSINYAPVAKSVSPSSGEFLTNRNIKINSDYSDYNGWQDLSYVNFVMNSNISNSSEVWTAYYPLLKIIDMRDDKNNSIIAGNCSVGESKIIENSCAKIDCSKTEVFEVGETVNISWNLILKDAIIGNCNLSIFAEDKKGLKTDWKEAGNCSIKKGSVPNCTDSDNGKNYDIKGTAKGENGEFIDYCIDNLSVKEYYCNNEEVEGITYKCPGMCDKGKCINATSSEDESTTTSTETEEEDDETTISEGESEANETSGDNDSAQQKNNAEIFLWVFRLAITIISLIVLIYLIYIVRKRKLKKPLTPVQNLTNFIPRNLKPPFFRSPNFRPGFRR
jgi:hypothetical protein